MIFALKYFSITENTQFHVSEVALWHSLQYPHDLLCKVEHERAYRTC